MEKTKKFEKLQLKMEIETENENGHLRMEHFPYSLTCSAF
jgi:hypothetical protein